MSDLETWKNVSLAKHGVVRVDPYGKLAHELVSSGKTVMLSRDDRLYYQRQAASDTLDIFQNGAMVPVRLVDETDIKEFAENPNLMGEQELTDLFKLQWKRFEARLNEITNLYALERMREFAAESDDVTVKKAQLVTDRIAIVKENSSHTTSILEGIQASSKRLTKDRF